MAKLKLFGLLFLITLVIGACDNPYVDVQVLAVPDIRGIQTGVYDTTVTFTIEVGKSLVAEYSIDGGKTWSEYVSPVTLTLEQNEFARLYQVTARHRDAYGNVSKSISPIYVYLTSVGIPSVSKPYGDYLVIQPQPDKINVWMNVDDLARMYPVAWENPANSATFVAVHGDKRYYVMILLLDQ